MKKRTVRRILVVLFIMGVTMLVAGIISRDLLLIVLGAIVIVGSVLHGMACVSVSILEEEKRIMECFDGE